jgi:hypothetical protein
VTVNSSASGVLDVVAHGFTNQGPNGPNPGQPFALPAPGVSSSKRWRDYRVEGAPSGINLIGQSHTFTLAGFQIAGTLDNGDPNQGTLQQGSIIRFTWNGPGTPTGLNVTPAPGGGFQCTVDVTGTCAVTVTSATPAKGTLTVTGIVVTLPDGTTSTSTTTYTLTYPDVALQTPAPQLTKSWAKFDVSVTPSSVNLIRQPHTFTITATQDLGAGPVPVADGTVVDYSWTGDGTANPPATCVTAGGSCDVTVNSDTFGVGTLTVVGLSNVFVNDGSTTTTFPQITADASGALTLPAPVQKRWVLVEVDITSGANNLAGEPHTFTVQVTGFDGEGGFPDGPVPNAVVDASSFGIVGGATLTNDGTCDEGTNAAGQCTLIVTNPGSGSIGVQLNQVTAIIDGQPFVVPLVANAPGTRADATFPIQSDKTWFQYRVMLSDSSTNPLGLSHTFTATVQRTDDNGATWTAVPDGAFLGDTWTDVNGGVSSVDPASTCLSPNAGTVGGTCTFVVTSTAPTTGTLDVTGILGTWLDRNRNGQAGRPTDPTPDPVELANEIVDIPASALATSSILTAQKTWWDFTVDVQGPAENPLGTNHGFTLTVRYSDGAGFHAVAPHTTLDYTWAGPAGSAEITGQSTCDPGDTTGTDSSGQCTVVVSSPTAPGTGTLTITGIDSTTIPQPTRTISYTFGTPGVTQKTWIAYQASISADATNLAGQPHTFTVTVQQDRGDGAGFVAVPDGTTVAMDLSNLGTLVSDSCTTGTVGGTCTAVVSSPAPGSVTVTPDVLTVQLLDGSGGTVPVTVQPGSAAYASPIGATKTWVGFRLGVSPSATNLVGQAHTFTITAEYATTAGVWQPLTTGDVAFSWNSSVGVIDAGTTTCSTLAADGTCTVTVTSTVPGSGTIQVIGLVSATVTVGGSSTTFTNVTTATAPDAIEFTNPSATKTWAAYLLTITPSAQNPAGVQHDFVISATRLDGSTSPAAGVSVTYDWSGDGTLLTPAPCTTDANGQCTVSVTSPTSGSGTLTVTSLTDGTFTIDLTVPNAPGQAAGQAVPLSASKTWLSYRVSLTAPATNLIGQSHTFTATVQQTGVANPVDSDWVAVPDGTTLSVTPTGTGTIDPASTCTTTGTTISGAAGLCTFVVRDAGPGTLQLTVTAIAATTIGITPYTDLTLIEPAQTSKTWVGYTVTISPSAINPAGQPHTFTITASRTDGDPVNGATIDFTWTGSEPASPAASCTTDATGKCAVIVTSATGGGGTLTVTRLVDGAFTVDLTTTGSTIGRAPDQVVPVHASKAWQTYRVMVSASATNAVGTPHTFDVTVQETEVTNPTEADWVTVPNGTTLAATTSGQGAIDPKSTCNTTGTAAGACTFVVTDTGPGTLTLTIGAVAATVIDGIPVFNLPLPQPVQRTKTWLGYRVVLPPNATNDVGVPHTFTAKVQFTSLANPAESDWSAVPNGTTLTVTSTGVGSITTSASTCLTSGTVGGTCTIVVADAGVGTLTITATAIAATTVDGAAFSNVALVAPATTSKTWVSPAAVESATTIPPTSPPPAVSSTEALSFTGGSSRLLITLGLLALMVGLGLCAVARFRRPNGLH